MATKERPILMSAPMVRAILDGRKTHTRRIVKFPAQMMRDDLKTPADVEEAVATMNDAENKAIGRRGPCDGVRYTWRSPYGKPGDRLWVRETWRLHWSAAGGCGIQYEADKAVRSEDKGEIVIPSGAWHTLYKLPPPKYCDNSQPRKKRPSLFMPRWASRLTLEITAVRVEPLHAMTEDDARAEGCTLVWPLNPDVGEFVQLWNKLHGAGAWDKNPFVWVMEFKVIAPVCQPLPQKSEAVQA